MHVPLQLWSAFFTLVATIGPVETAAVFASLTSGYIVEIGLAWQLVQRS